MRKHCNELIQRLLPVVSMLALGGCVLDSEDAQPGEQAAPPPLAELEAEAAEELLQSESIGTAACTNANFSLHLQQPGIQVYRRNTGWEYVTVVNLAGAKLRNLGQRTTGTPSCPGGTLFTRTQQQFWSDALAHNTATRTLQVAINGAFSGGCNPANVAHGLKMNGNLVTWGYETPPPGGNTLGAPASEFRVLSWDNAANAATVSVWSTSAFDNWRDAVGGFQPYRVVSGSSRPRTYAGVRGGWGSEVVLFTSQLSRTPQEVAAIMGSFCVPDTALVQLDGGGSTWLTLNMQDDPYRLDSSRALPHALAAYSLSGDDGGTTCPCRTDVDNFCLYGVNNATCPPTQPGGYCDPNGDGNFSDADWTRGYNEYQAQCR